MARTVNDILRAASDAVDLLHAGESALDELRTTADLLHAYKVQCRKLKNARPALRWWHRWRRNRLEALLRERLGLGPGAQLPP